MQITEAFVLLLVLCSCQCQKCFSSTGHTHTPSPRSPGESGSGLRPVRSALLKLHANDGRFSVNSDGSLFSAGKSCSSSSTQTAGTGPGAEERRGGDHTGLTDTLGHI